MFVYGLLLVCTYVHISGHIMVCIFAYIHIFPLSVGGKGQDKESVRREEWVRRRWKKSCYNQKNLFFLLILPIFLIAKGLFDVNMKCLFCGEFYLVVMMMIKIKIIIMLLFFKKDFCHFIFYL